MDASAPLQRTNKLPSAKEMTEQASFSGNCLQQEPSLSSADEECANTFTKSDHAAWDVFNADISMNEFDDHIDRQVAVTDGNEQRLIENSSKFVSDFVKNFQPISVLGKGGFGVVFECRSKVDQCSYAIKRIRLSNKPGSKKKAEREVRALERLKHDNIVGYITHWTETPPQEWQEKADKDLMSDISWLNLTTSSSDDENNDPTFLYIQMELCKKESLQIWLENNHSRDYLDCLKMFHQVLSAVEYIHDNNLIHRDLKPSNIMFSLHGVIKVGDFGLVTETNNEMINDISKNSEINTVEYKTNESTHTKGAGTKSYMAPEQMSGGNYGKEVDIFALGLILVELVSPFSTQAERTCKMENARDSKFDENFINQHETGLLKLVKLMVLSQPSHRPTAQHGKIVLTYFSKATIFARRLEEHKRRLGEHKGRFDKRISKELKEIVKEFEVFLKGFEGIAKELVVLGEDLKGIAKEHEGILKARKDFFNEIEELYLRKYTYTGNLGKKIDLNINK